MVQNWLAAQAQARPNAKALIADGQSWTYVQLHEWAGYVAGTLAGLGVQAGERVAVMMPNRAEYVVVIHALTQLRAVLVPLNIRLTAAEVRYQIALTGSKWLIHDGHVDPPKSDGLTVLSIDETAQDKHLYNVDAVADIHLDQLQAIVFTSGTSGRPKGAMLTYGNQFYSAMASAYRLGTMPDDRWLCILPLYHVGGLAIVMRCCLYGTAMVLHNGFDVNAVTQALETEQIKLISLVPTMLYRLLNEPRAVEGLKNVRLVLLGGAAASVDLLQHCVAYGIPAAPTYGLSEACSQVATMLPADAQRKPGSVGKPMLFGSIRIVNEQNEEADTGEFGEVLVKGPNVMAGYYNNAEATASALQDGWLHTGDIGYLDAEGDLWLVQRRSDLIVSGGENVYPAEVEQVLEEHPAVAAVCVVGVDHPEWGQQVAATVVLREGMSLTQAELIAFSRERLAGYKQPRRVLFVEALPQTASGKIQRRAVAELFPK